MKAAFFYGPNKIKIEDSNIDNASNENENENVVLKVLSCSVCSYDIRTYRNGSFKVKPPIVLGHEICAETTSNINGKNFSIKSEERVSIYPVIPCLHCWHCNQKKYNLCSNLKEIGSTVNGGFAEYITIPKKLFDIGGVVPVLDNVTNEEASLIEPLACCINGISQIKSIDFDSIVIIGDGPIGLMQVMLLKRKYPSIPIMVVGRINHRLDAARRMGADGVYDMNMNSNFEHFSKLLTDLNNRQAPNLVFVSNNSPESLKDALSLANKNGKIVIFSGVKKPDSESRNLNSNPAIDANYIHYNQISVMGSFSSVPDNFKKAMELVNSEEIKIKGLITNTFELQSLEDAIKNSESFRGLKSIINKF